MSLKDFIGKFILEVYNLHVIVDKTEALFLDDEENPIGRYRFPRDSRRKLINFLTSEGIPIYEVQ